MLPLWKIRSGNFAGYRVNDALYNEHGENVGYFINNLAYSVKDGKCIGEIYQNDWIGKNNGITYPLAGSRIPYTNISAVSCVNRVGLGFANWEDPDF
jgi:hypothetical protein